MTTSLTAAAKVAKYTTNTAAAILLIHRGLQVKEEKLAKKAKLASKTKLSFADDVEEEAVRWQRLLHIASFLVCMDLVFIK